MREVLDPASHTQVTLRRGQGIAQSRCEADLQVRRDAQDGLDLNFDVIRAEAAQYLHADAKTFGDEPQVLHDAPEAHEAERIAFCGRRLESTVMDDDQQQGTFFDRPSEVNMN